MPLPMPEIRPPNRVHSKRSCPANRGANGIDNARGKQQKCQWPQAVELSFQGRKNLFHAIPPEKMNGSSMIPWSYRETPLSGC